MSIIPCLVEHIKAKASSEHIREHFLLVPYIYLLLLHFYYNLNPMSMNSYVDRSIVLHEPRGKAYGLAALICAES